VAFGHRAFFVFERESDPQGGLRQRVKAVEVFACGAAQKADFDKSPECEG